MSMWRQHTSSYLYRTPPGPPTHSSVHYYNVTLLTRPDEHFTKRRVFRCCSEPGMWNWTELKVYPPRGLLYPGLPAVEESAEVLGVHGLLDEQVDLPPHAEDGALLHPLQLLLQPQQHPLRHLVKALAVAALKGDISKRCLYKWIQCWLHLFGNTEKQKRVHVPCFAVADDVVGAAAPHGGAEGGVELLLLVVLQVEGLQRVHGPVKQRVVEQNLGGMEHRVRPDQWVFSEQEGAGLPPS